MIGVLSAVVGGCVFPPEPTGESEQLSYRLPADTIVVAVRDSLRPAVEVFDAGRPLAGAPLEFTSEDPALVRVNRRGDVVGVRRGVTRLRARLRSAAAGVNAPDTVVPVRVVIGRLEPARPVDTIIALGESRTFADFLPRYLSPSGAPLTAEEAPGVAPRLQIVSAGAAVRFDATATFLVAQANGTDTVRATVDTSSALLVVTVRQRADTVAINPRQHLFVSLAESLALQVSVADRRGNAIAAPAVTWTSANPAIVTVDAMGLAVAAANGATTLVATVDGVADAIAVSVDQRAARIVVTPGSAFLTTGATQSFRALAYDANGNLVPDSIFAWRSLNPELVNRRFFPALGPVGTFQVAASGQAAVGAQMDGVEGYALANVTQPGLTAPQSWVADVSGTSAQLRGIWGVGPSSVLVVGFEGTILQQSGASWSRVPVSIAENLVAVWGASASDVLAVGNLAAQVGGEGRVFRFNGTSWFPETTPTTDRLFGVWGAAPDAVFAVGENGRVLMFDGTAWQVGVTDLQGPGFPVLRSVWGTSATDVWVIGSQGTILRYDGAVFRRVPSGTTETLIGIWGVSDTTVFVSGNNGTILLYDGSSWTRMVIPASVATRNLNAVWGTSATDVYAAGQGGVLLRYDGATWTTVTTGLGSTDLLQAIWGFGPGDLIIAGDNGTLLRGRR